MRALLILFFLLPHLCIAQTDFREGYILTNDNDTVFGWIDYAIPTSNSKFCFYKSDELSDIEKFTPGDIRGFGFINDNQYVSKQISFNDQTTEIFLEYLVDGQIDLYYYLKNGRDYYYFEKDGILYQLDNEEIVVNKGNKYYTADSKKFMGRLKWILSDSDLPAYQIEKTKFSHESLIEITKEYHYNVCEDEQCIIYYRSNKAPIAAKWRFNVGLSAGTSRTNLDMQTTTYQEGKRFGYLEDRGLYLHSYTTTETNANINETASSFLPGIFLNISRNRVLSFQVGAQFQTLVYNNIKFSNVNLPLTINYDLLRQKKITPYVSTGTFFYIQGKTSFNDLYITYDDYIGLTFNGFVTTPVEEFINYPRITSYTEQLSDTYYEMDNQGINMIFGLGVKYQLVEKMLMKLDFSYMSNTQRIISPIVHAPGAESFYKLRSFNATLSLQYNIL
jgi:hypothetical protein